MVREHPASGRADARPDRQRRRLQPRLVQPATRQRRECHADAHGGNGEITGQNEEEAPVETEPAINEPAIEEEPIVEPEVAPEQNEISEPAIINEGETAGGEGEASPETTPPSNPPPENNNVEISQQTAGE